MSKQYDFVRGGVYADMNCNTMYAEKWLIRSYSWAFEVGRNGYIISIHTSRKCFLYALNQPDKKTVSELQEATPW